MEMIAESIARVHTHTNTSSLVNEINMSIINKIVIKPIVI